MPVTLPKSPLPEAKPTSLKDLLALSPEELDRCDVARVNLLCAEGLRGAEDMNVESLLDTLDAWTKHVESETQKNFHRFLANPREYNQSLAYYRMLMLATVLQQDFGTFYNPERAEPQLRGERESDDVFFGDSRDVFLNGLLAGKHFGTCASLPVLYTVVAQRLGYPVKLATAAGHFFVRYEEGGEHLNVEATSIGFNTHPDEFYRQWPFPVSDADVRLYGLLRSRTNRELLGDFLTTRAATLESMKRFDEAAEMWAAAAKHLPETPALKEIVQHARDRAGNERNANRWDALAEELTVMPVFFDDRFEYFQNKKVRVQQFMRYNTNLVAIEAAVKELKDELEAHRRELMLASDSPRTVAPQQPRIGAASPELANALANPPEPRRIRIPAERLPFEYQKGLPPELLDRLSRSGATREDDLVVEIQAFKAEEDAYRGQQRFREQQAFAREPEPLRQLALRQEQVRRQNEELIYGRPTVGAPHPTDPHAPLLGPPIHVEIIPPQKGTP